MLTELSVIYSMPHALILFIFLFEYRCSKKTFSIVTAVSISAMSLVTIWIMFRFGLSTAGQTVALTCSIPSFIIFYILSKDRGADSCSRTVLWILCASG